MSGALTGKAVLVTGGAKRVGAAICRRLHAAGANVVVHYHRSAAEAQALLRELNGLREDTLALVCADLLTPGALPQLVKDALAAFGRLDVLVNNASTFYPTPVGAINEQVWEDLIGTNLKVPLFLAQAAAPALRKAQGSIVNIIDIHAELPMKNHLVYNTAKGGLLALTRSLARELGPQVRVNGVSPGTILWPDDPAWQNDLERQRIVNQTALKRSGEPDDIARAVEFLITAPYVTGQIIAVDGGRSISIA
ncbi:MAG: pteridine reductase [Burkholderiales bacterium]|nr:pteridine reductase [Burkholderiales bacterium]